MKLIGVIKMRNNYEYQVVVDDVCVARFMELKDALVYIKACDQEYHSNINWNYTIHRYDGGVEEVHPQNWGA